MKEGMRVRLKRSNLWWSRLSGLIVSDIITPVHIKVRLEFVDDVQEDALAAVQSDKSGATCKRCNQHNEYTAPSAAYVCFECRT